MDPTVALGHLLGLVGQCAAPVDAAQMTKSALPELVALAGCETALVVRREHDDLVLVAQDGPPLAHAPLAAVLGPGEPGTLVGVEPPGEWTDLGVASVRAQRLPGHTGVLVLAWRTSSPDVAHLDTALLALETGLSRVVAEEALADLANRVDGAQQLAGMGDYDWHIASDTNQWSDQLYRIYGFEPQSFNASYDRFLSLVHPEDRERVTELHQRAYATGQPFQMIERIIRPDGQVRHLASTGEVLLDEQGTPVRMRGTCIDVTDRVEAEAVAVRLGEMQLRRRQALEINDNVVQGLVAASYALDEGEIEMAGSYVGRTLSSARAMMDDLLDPVDGVGLQPGDLVRSAAAEIGAPAHQQPARVLVVDDAEDLRMLLRVRIERTDGLVVAGEAADGLAAVEQARQLQPDLVLLDLAMPRMDGLEALPLIQQAVPGVHVVVLSGFNEETLAEKALRAGADRYVVKGGSMRELMDLVLVVLGRAT